MHLALFVKNGIFSYKFDLETDFLTGKMTLSYKNNQEMDCPVK